MVGLPSGQSVFVERYAGARWGAALRSDVGLVRPRLEDSWQVLFGVPLAGEAWDAFAVFDGIGGGPHGQEAAWAAAQHLEAALAHASGPGDVLRRLDDAVLATGGAATAAVVLSPCARPGELWLLGAGDSSVHARGVPASILPHDRAGRHVVTDALGLPLRRGHLVPWRAAPGDALLLCTDGVDEVAGADAVQECLAAAGEPASLERLFARVTARGAPDNATALLLRRA